jgi:hypothetical protein
MRVPVLLLLALAGAARAQQPPLRYTVSPVPIKGGQEVTVSIPAFGSQRLTCSAFIVGADCQSDEQPCGPQAAVLRMTPTVLSVGKVTIQIDACPTSQRDRTIGNCWSYGGDVASDLHPSAAAAVRAPAKNAPATGVLSDSKAPSLLRSGAPDAPPAAASGGHWSAEPPAKAALPPEPVGRRFRGHDGRVYEREDPAAGSVTDKDEKYRRALAADPVVRAAFDNWRNLDDAGRRDALQRMSDIQASAYGVAPSQVALQPNGKPPGMVAHYTGADRKMTINTSNPYYNSPSMQINAVSHEARHRWQHSLVLRLPSRDLDVEERVMAKAFKVSFDNYCSPGGARDCDYSTYRNQLVERDAFEQGEAAALYFRTQPQ